MVTLLFEDRIENRRKRLIPNPNREKLKDVPDNNLMSQCIFLHVLVYYTGRRANFSDNGLVILCLADTIPS